MSTAELVNVPSRATAALIKDAFVATGLPEADAARCAELMTQADLTGADGHGILRLPQYINIARFVPLKTFTSEVDRHIHDLRASKRLPGVEAIRLPGDRRSECRAEHARDGVPLAKPLLAQLDKLADELKIRPLRER
jgi:LDH2 family malate/lactate/ureidoglycolate dehydrogenase